MRSAAVCVRDLARAGKHWKKKKKKQQQKKMYLSGASEKKRWLCSYNKEWEKKYTWLNQLQMTLKKESAVYVTEVSQSHMEVRGM